MAYGLCCMGNPLMDITVQVGDDFLSGFNLEKGGMHLVSREESQQLLGMLKDKEKIFSPGGSSANVAAGFSLLGGRSFFMGSVGKDDQGSKYRGLMQDAGVACSLPEYEEPTGHAITFITPDKERTFGTFLGSSLRFQARDLDIAAIKSSDIFHFTGFMLETPNQRNAVLQAVRAAGEGDTLVSLDVGDSLWARSNVDEVLEMCERYVDIIFANTREAASLTRLEGEKAVRRLNSYCDIAVVTMGKEGSVIARGDRVYRISAYGVEEVNTNGAGDMYDAGLLYGLVKGWDLEKSGKLASFLAAQAVAVPEARPSRLPPMPPELR